MKLEIGQFWIDNSKNSRIVQIVDIRGDLVRVKTIARNRDLISSGYIKWMLKSRMKEFTFISELGRQLL